MTFKPSQVVLGTPPLTACFEKTEAECAAGLLVFGLQKAGNEWQAISAKQLGAVMKLAMQAGDELMVSWNRNPFFRPDFDRLVNSGYVERIKTDDGDVMRFTEAGLARMRRWVRPEVASP